jgi:hypothetical protein
VTVKGHCRRRHLIGLNEKKVGATVAHESLLTIAWHADFFIV